MSKTKILIAESADIPLFGLLAILNNCRSMEVLDTAATSDEAVKLYAKRLPDLCLVSSGLKGLNIHTFMQKLLAEDENAKVVLLTDEIDINYLNQALKAGVSGCLLKNIKKQKLRDLLISAAAGERVFSSSISNLMTDLYADLAHKNSRKKPFDVITKRENEVLQMIVKGHTSHEIAKILYISPRTVETHRSNLLQKLNIKNTAGLVRFALEEGNFSQP